MNSQNRFGKTSRLSVQAERKSGKTVITELSFTAPYKVMHPFPKANGGARLIPLCASAGIMEGDTQELYYRAGEGTDLEIHSQSYEKIHKMGLGSASRKVHVDVEKNAVLYYTPQPVIPFAGSAFDAEMEIHLADKTSRLFLQEIISNGRIAMGEIFSYRRFSSKVLIYCGEKMIYRDNTCFEPEIMPMSGLGFFEGYTHQANIFMAGSCAGLSDKIWRLLMQAQDSEGGVTTLTGGELVVRIGGNRAQKLERIAETIKSFYERLIGN